MTTETSKPVPVPAGFERHHRSSPLTEPWEPLYSRALDGQATQIGLVLREAHCNSRGFAHGGLISALADNSMGLSCVARARSNGAPTAGGAVTVSLTLDFIDAGRIGDWLEVRPVVLKVGRTLGFAECRVVALRNNRDGAPEELLIARGNASFRML